MIRITDRITEIVLFVSLFGLTCFAFLLRRVLKEAGYHLTDDGLDILVDDDTDGEEDTDDCVYPPEGSDWAPRTPGGSDWAPRTPGGSDWAESIEQQDGDWLPADISEERWSDDDGTTQHVVPYMDMWEDAEGEEGPSATLFSVEPCRAPRLDLPPPDSGVEPDMVYVPSVLHAASTLQVAARVAWRGDDRPGLPPRRSEHPTPTVPNSVHLTHLLTVEPGQFDDDTTCTDLNLQLAAFEQLHIKSELT